LGDVKGIWLIKTSVSAVRQIMQVKKMLSGWGIAESTLWVGILACLLYMSLCCPVRLLRMRMTGG